MRENVRLFFIVYSCVNIIYTVAVQYRGIVAKNQKFQAWKKLCYLAFSGILWYNGPTEVYNEKISYDTNPLLDGRFVIFYYFSHYIETIWWNTSEFSDFIFSACRGNPSFSPSIATS